MILLLLSIVFFVSLAIRYGKSLSINKVIHITCFTMAFQLLFDLIVEFKFGAYWYFSKGVDWLGLLAHTLLIPPVNILFLSLFPFYSSVSKKIMYILVWTAGINLYEMVALLPEPFGFFYLGWWKVWYDWFVVPGLLLCLLGYYKWIHSIEKGFSS